MSPAVGRSAGAWAAAALSGRARGAASCKPQSSSGMHIPSPRPGAASPSTGADLIRLFVTLLWQCGSVAVWHCGAVTAWLRVNATVPLCGLVTLWRCHFVAPQHRGIVAPWRPGFLSAAALRDKERK